jgi:hypothetical protein
MDNGPTIRERQPLSEIQYSYAVEYREQMSLRLVGSTLREITIQWLDEVIQGCLLCGSWARLAKITNDRYARVTCLRSTRSEKNILKCLKNETSTREATVGKSRETEK